MTPKSVIPDRETLARRRPGWWRALLHIERCYNQVGITPPIREVAEASGLSLTATNYALHNLAEMGFLRRLERGADSHHRYFLPVGPTPGELASQVRSLELQLKAVRERTSRLLGAGDVRESILRAANDPSAVLAAG